MQYHPLWRIFIFSFVYFTSCTSCSLLFSQPIYLCCRVHLSYAQIGLYNGPRRSQWAKPTPTNIHYQLLVAQDPFISVRIGKRQKKDPHPLTSRLWIDYLAVVIEHKLFKKQTSISPIIRVMKKNEKPMEIILRWKETIYLLCW